MQKFLSILLLVLFGFPSVSPLLALGTDADSGLPICCRKNGAHHCQMKVAAQDDSSGHHHIGAPGQHCPYCPKTVSTTSSDLFGPGVAGLTFSDPVSHPTGIVQTESKRRISRDRSRQKRGPPVLSLL